jgi:hypothetical protein
MHATYIIEILVISYIKYILSLSHDFLAHAHVSLAANHFFSIFNPQPLYSSHIPLSYLFLHYPLCCIPVSPLLRVCCIIITIPFLFFLSCTWKQFVQILFKQLGSGFDEESGLTEHNTTSVGHISGVISLNHFTEICSHFSYFSHIQNDLI